jgi:hypothetical protein
MRFCRSSGRRLWLLWDVTDRQLVFPFGREVYTFGIEIRRTGGRCLGTDSSRASRQGEGVLGHQAHQYSLGVLPQHGERRATGLITSRCVPALGDDP